MKCPSCDAAAPEGAPECASCGVIFAKFEEKRRRTREEAEQALARMNLPPVPDVDLHLGRRIGTVLAAAWAAVMGFFIVKEMLRRDARAAAARAEAADQARTPTAALSAHAVIAEPSGQFTNPSGEAVSPRGR